MKLQNMSINIPFYYYLSEDNKVIFDEESMKEEYNKQLNDAKEKFENKKEDKEEKTKNLDNFENELAEFLSQYIYLEKAEKHGDDYPNEHDFFNIVESCEELIERINKGK